MAKRDPRRATAPARRGRSLAERVYEVLARPATVVIAVAAALLGLAGALWLDLHRLSERALVTQAESINRVLTDVRQYYARNVVARVRAPGDGAADAGHKVLHDYAEVPGAIPIPATLSIELAGIIGAQEGNVVYRFVSDAPFRHRPPHQLSPFERRALARFRAEPDLSAVTHSTGTIFNQTVRQAVPVAMAEACVGCHNSHPASPRHDWQVGDVRGVEAVTVSQPIAANLLAFRYLLTYVVVAGALGLAFAGVQRRQAQHFRALSDQLGEANGFLQEVSQKLAKYLSPQVYRSIFRGEKAVALGTERKKLTIFFSDLKDFTEQSERMQPEELTALLNEYFTEMSQIAQAHGATVDKFIGDAILAFFGDPETRGPEADARACVAMAVAMQRRLAELNGIWRRRGIERPLRARIGINTGYCNVGNFGSADRMDYTIIGAEANLAARLEGVAEPGGIVLSYETYALVQDMVDAVELPPFRLKGIAREVVPYAVQNVLGPGGEAESGVVRRTGPGVNLYLDPAKVEQAARDDIAEALETALARLGQGRGRG